MRKILLHDQKYSVGGPKAVLDGIQNSYLEKKFEFVRLCQTEACGFNPFKAIMFINKYRKLINKENADVIYICGLQYTGLLMTIASKLSNVRKVVLSVHGSDWDNPNGSLRKWILMHIVEPLEIKLADSVFTVCDAAQKGIKPLHGKKNNEGVVYNTFPNVDYSQIPKGLLRNELNVDDEKIIVASVGRVVEAKGHREIIEAIKSIADEDFIFVVVGDGPYLDQYKNKCEEEIKNRRLFLLGRRCDVKISEALKILFTSHLRPKKNRRLFLLGRRCDVNNILRDSDIFLFATYNENHSIALMEAVNMHCAVLCTNVGGNAEIIQDKVSGLLIPSKDSNSIIDGLKELKDKEIRDKYVYKAFKECCTKFSSENTYGKLEKIFKD